MAVRNVLATGIADLLAAKPSKPDVVVAHGALRTSCFVADILNGDSIASTFVVARLPSHARLSQQSELRCTAVTGGAGTLGTAEAPACLMAAQSIAAATTVRGLAAIAVGNDAMPLWQLAGLLSDPKREMEILFTLTAATTAAGKAVFDLVYISD